MKNLKHSSTPMEVVLIVHADKDGADSAFVLEENLKLISENYNIPVNISIYYCDGYNIDAVMKNVTSNIKDIENTKVFITDVPGIGGEEMEGTLDALHKSGLDIFRSDHHQDAKNEYEWTYCSHKENRCCAMENFLSLASLKAKGMNISLHEYLQEHLKINNDTKTIEYMLNETEKIKGDQKFEKLTAFFERLLGFDGRLKMHEINNDALMPKLAKLAMSANLVDFRKEREMPGLSSIIAYMDYVLSFPQYSGMGLNERSNSERMAKVIKEKVMDGIYNLPFSEGWFKSEVERISKLTNPEQRKKLSKESIKFYKVTDRNGNESTIAVTAGEFDIRFRHVEDLRLRMRSVLETLNVAEILRIDHFISLTSNFVGDAIATDKPIEMSRLLRPKKSAGKFKKVKRKVSISREIAHRKIIEGSPNGVALPISNEVLKTIIQLRSEIAKLMVCEEKARSKESRKAYRDIVIDKQKVIEQLMLQELNELFDNVKEIIPKKKFRIKYDHRKKSMVQIANNFKDKRKVSGLSRG